jgi:hypothetical protein
LTDIQHISPEQGPFGEPARPAVSVVWLTIVVGLMGFWAAVFAMVDALA